MIDDLIYGLYNDKADYVELEALQKLFSDEFLISLEDLLNDPFITRNNERNRLKISIEIGWIDKRPVADFIDDVTDWNGYKINPEKVEIGDFMLVKNNWDYYQNSDSTFTQFNDHSRALIIQAKKALNTEPHVPITPLDPNKYTSTSKQLALLSNWPAFDLYETGANKDLIEHNIQIDKKGKTAFFAGYYQRKWYCGAPQYDNLCSTTLGQTIQDLIANRVGVSFNLNKNHPSDWDRLINAILSICAKYDLPKSLFPNGGKRLITSFLQKGDYNDSDEDKFPIIAINIVRIEGQNVVDEDFDIVLQSKL